MKQNKLTVGQLAAYANVTPRTVRHYHAIDLLPEPMRDTTGYRRYDAQDAISLIRIKTLTDAGIPLAQIQQVLRAKGVEFDKTISDIEVGITKHIKELGQTKKKLHKLKSGEALYLKPEVLAYLNRLRQLGISEEQVLIERDGWVLLSALIPNKINMMIDQKNTMLNDEKFVQIYKKYDMARSWRTNDPRLEALANEIIKVALSHDEKTKNVKSDNEVDDVHLQSIISMYQDDLFPAWKRLNEIIESRSK